MLDAVFNHIGRHLHSGRMSSNTVKIMFIKTGFIFKSSQWQRIALQNQESSLTIPLPLRAICQLNALILKWKTICWALRLLDWRVCCSMLGAWMGPAVDTILEAPVRLSWLSPDLYTQKSGTRPQHLAQWRRVPCGHELSSPDSIKDWPCVEVKDPR